MRAYRRSSTIARDGICARRGRILHRLAADFEAAHRRRRPAARSKKPPSSGSPYRSIASFISLLGAFEIARIERGFVSIEQRGGSRKLDRRASLRARGRRHDGGILCSRSHASASMRSSVFSANSRQSSRPRTRAASRIRGDEHRVPADVDRLVDGGRGAACERGYKHFALGAGEHQPRIWSSLKFNCAGDIFDGLRNPEDIFRGIVMHLAVRANVVINFGRRALLPERAPRGLRRASR